MYFFVITLITTQNPGCLFTWWRSAMAIASKHPAGQWEVIAEKGTNNFSQLLAFFDILG